MSLEIIKQNNYIYTIYDTEDGSIETAQLPTYEISVLSINKHYFKCKKQSMEMWYGIIDDTIKIKSKYTWEEGKFKVVGSYFKLAYSFSRNPAKDYDEVSISFNKDIVFSGGYPVEECDKIDFPCSIPIIAFFRDWWVVTLLFGELEENRGRVSFYLDKDTFKLRYVTSDVFDNIVTDEYLIMQNKARLLGLR